MIAEALSGVLAVALGLSVRQGLRLRAERDRLRSERAVLLSDDGVRAYLEASEAAGSMVAVRLLVAAKALPELAPPRTILGGEDRKAFQADFDASTSPSERGSVIERWHKKGYTYPPDMRAWILKNALHEETRKSWRKMFDEQDAPPEEAAPAPQALAAGTPQDTAPLTGGPPGAKE